MQLKENPMFITKTYIFRGDVEQQFEQQKLLQAFGDMGIAVSNVQRHPTYFSFTLATVVETLQQADLSAYEELTLGSQEWKDECEFPAELLFRLHAIDRVDDEERLEVLNIIEHKIGHRVGVKDIDIYTWLLPKETRNAFRDRMRKHLKVNDSHEFFHKGKKFVFVVI